MTETEAKDYVATYQCSCGNYLQYFGVERNSGGERIVKVFCPGNPNHSTVVRMRTLRDEYELERKERGK